MNQRIMPSGAKKRKAAKKKKETQADNNVIPLQDSHEEDDLKNQSQEDKDSDVSELSSPTSQENRGSHENVSSASEGEEIEDRESKTDQGIEGEEQSSIQVEGEEPKIEDESDAKEETSKPDGESRVIEIDDSSDSTAPQKPTGAIEKVQETIDLDVEESPIPITEKDQLDAEAERSMAKQSSVEDEVDRSMPSTEEDGKGTARAVEQNAKTSDSYESDDALMVSYDASKALDDYVLVSEQDYAVAHPTHTALQQHPGRNTTWKNCCGLFELFSGSSR